eukprot:CAMPEP_0184973408 /NCGR_PEP_ID=MMETSP1098-20130426/5203_1 /TAXON_ID=89044 /ORGANISM="Spumella elongata, Strain CCAP 955/1" /LENGTH=225 /DNA_ID=CAMNT_0027495861 /DNA_START=28 /DNA_END=705 /DNA_ORIENTATION=-
MSGLVFIDDEDNNVLDEWMNETSSFVKGSTDVDIGEPVGVTSKGGLGFVETKTGNKQGDTSNKKPANKAVNKKRALVHEDDEMHGMVEHIEESRTSIKGKPVKQSAVINNDKGNNQGKQNKKSKPNAEGPKAVVATAKPVEKNASEVAKAVAADGGAAAAGGETAEQRENSRKRKRTKTRSKQKNIRRDNRPAESKPAYLHVGNKEFKGRQLTEQTKSVLGLTKK